MRSLFFVLSWTLALPAIAAKPAPGPQISVSREVVCGVANWSGLEGKQDVRCWDFARGGKLLPALPVKTALQVAASERTVCVLEPRELYCWEYLVDTDGKITVEAKKYFQAMKAPYLLAAGANGQFCAYDQKTRLSCSHLTTVGGGPFIRPFALALGSDQQICVLHNLGRYDKRCIVGIGQGHDVCRENLNKIYFSDPTAQQIYLSHGKQPDCGACMLGTSDANCWGDGHVPAQTHRSALRHPTHLAFLSLP